MAVLNKKKDNIPPDAVYIGRGSQWGNPYIMGIHGTRDEVCDAYKKFLKDQIVTGQITVENLAALHGKDLVCFCAPLRCHGDVLTKVSTWAYQQLNNS